MFFVTPCIFCAGYFYKLLDEYIEREMQDLKLFTRIPELVTSDKLLNRVNVVLTP